MGIRKLQRRVIRNAHGLAGVREWSDLTRQIKLASRPGLEDTDKAASLRASQRAMLPGLSPAGREALAKQQEKRCLRELGPLQRE